MEILRSQDFGLRHLRYFIAVTENKNYSISEVAEELHMAEPNLSQQLKDLETKLTVKLFERQKAHIKPHCVTSVAR
ncbi:LysR family transcriptional regulator [Fischerella thermalis CCMEE 5205]|uniref:helix-turn-helix domain-containing protein n=1 Tax=Fischerella thermalis TaxID=372787 RepID=UPI000C7F878D|nr:LysR family transcriptional regulator [Fischerella thermalis CCMEE 5328]PMB47306.1 LysR family transcriptional regulator [Fischerella thermalis CCMEE 5205]